MCKLISHLSKSQCTFRNSHLAFNFTETLLVYESKTMIQSHFLNQQYHFLFIFGLIFLWLKSYKNDRNVMNINISVTFVHCTINHRKSISRPPYLMVHIIIYQLLDHVYHTYADFILVRYSDMRSSLPMIRIIDVIDRRSKSATKNHLVGKRFQLALNGRLYNRRG